MMNISKFVPKESKSKVISKSDESRKGKKIVFWTKNEVEKLQELYPNHSNSEITQS